jgi:outer membrane protein TolC
VPLYTGGAIPAIQAGADGAVEVARARQAGGRDLSRVRLVRTYFGQQVAAQLTRSTRETLAGFDRHLSDAVKLEQNGVIPHARVLQVQVARDAAERAFIRAQLEEATAADALSRLLDRPAGVGASTPLFVNSQPLPPVGTFLEGIDATPRARGADAARDIASAGVGLAKSRYRPQAFAFGSYNANRDNALPTDTRNRDRSVGERRLCRFGACLFGRDVTAERRQRLCPHLEQRAAAEPNSVAAGCPSRSPPNRCSIGRVVTRAMSFRP